MKKVLVLLALVLASVSVSFDTHVSLAATDTVTAVSGPVGVAAPAEAPKVESSGMPSLKPPSDIFAAPQWLKDILIWVSSFPIVGPYAVKVLQWLGVVAAAMSAVYVALLSIFQTLITLATRVGAASIAEKLGKAWIAIAPWLKLLSVFNTQKQEIAASKAIVKGEEKA